MYSYENYSKVKAEIEKRRSDAIATADYHSELVREKSPEIARIDEELAGTGMLLFKTACAGGDIAPLKERNQKLVARRKDLIVEMGYPRDFTEVHYTCTECSDTGFINGTKLCRCFREALIRATVASSGIGHLIDKQNFDNFDLNWYGSDPALKEKMAAVVAAAKNYVKNFAKRRANLLLMGTTGTGKTHISTAIAAEIIKKGYDVIYDSAQNIINDFEFDKFKSGYGREESRSDKYLECDLLIIDDLGTEFTSQFALSCLYNLLNTRQNKGLATIVSTNLTSEELSGKYEGRITSRLMSGRILAFDGRDHRIFG